MSYTVIDSFIDTCETALHCVHYVTSTKARGCQPILVLILLCLLPAVTAHHRGHYCMWVPGCGCSKSSNKEEEDPWIRPWQYTSYTNALFSVQFTVVFFNGL